MWAWDGRLCRGEGERRGRRGTEWTRAVGQRAQKAQARARCVRPPLQPGSESGSRGRKAGQVLRHRGSRGVCTEAREQRGSGEETADRSEAWAWEEGGTSSVFPMPTGPGRSRGRGPGTESREGAAAHVGSRGAWWKMCRGRRGGARAWDGVGGAGYGFGRTAPCTVYEEEVSNALLQVRAQEELELARLHVAPECSTSGTLRWARGTEPSVGSGDVNACASQRAAPDLAVGVQG